MIKTILHFPIQLAQNVVTAKNKFVIATKNPLQTSVLSLKGLLNAFFAACMVFAVYYFFEPFGIKKYPVDNKLLLIGLSSVAAFSGIIISDFILPFIFRSYFNIEKWTISKQISLHILRFFFLGLAVMILGNQTGFASFDLPSFLMKFTAVGASLGVIAAFNKERLLKNRYQRKAVSINQNLMHLQDNPNSKKPLLIMSFSGSNDRINLVPNQLISISVNKYSADFRYQNLFGLVQKELGIRSKEVLSELNKYPQFIQLANGKFVNKNAIYKTTASAAGYSVFIAKTKNALLIPKKFQKDIESI